MVAAGDEGSDLPADSSVNFDDNKDVTVGLILAQSLEVKRRNRNVGAVNKRRPNVDLFVALVRRRDGGPVCDLLIPVGHVGVEAVVVNSDVVVWVSRRQRDLKIGC